MSMTVAEVLTALRDMIPEGWEVEIAEEETGMRIALKLPRGKVYRRYETNTILEGSRYRPEDYARWLIAHTKSKFNLGA